MTDYIQHTEKDAHPEEALDPALDPGTENLSSQKKDIEEKTVVPSGHDDAVDLSLQADKKMIMIVEDDFFISDIYDVRLSAAGYNVVIANNGREAIKKLEEGIAPDVILLDIIMPYVDGFDVLEAIAKHEEWQRFPIILLTNLSQKEDIDKALAMGAKDYLIKSHFTPSEVLSKIQKYIV